MAKATQEIEIPAEVRPVVEAAAKNLANHLWGAQRPAWGTSFTSLEGLTAQVTRLLGSQIMHHALSDSRPLDSFFAQRQQDATGQRPNSRRSAAA